MAKEKEPKLVSLKANAPIVVGGKLHKKDAAFEATEDEALKLIEGKHAEEAAKVE